VFSRLGHSHGAEYVDCIAILRLQPQHHKPQETTTYPDYQYIYHG
jgi:hypothetical protein